MPNRPPRKLSKLLQDALKGIKSNDITLRQLTDQLGTRAYGVFVVLLTLPCLIPGISLLGGLLLLVFSIQMAMGIERVWLPKIISNYTLEKKLLNKALNAFLPRLIRFEQYIKPRMALLSTGNAVRFMGLIISLFAFVILLPIPFSNLVPTLALLFMAFGILQKDGLTVIISAIIGTIYCITFLMFLGVLVEAILDWLSR